MMQMLAPGPLRWGSLVSGRACAQVPWAATVKLGPDLPEREIRVASLLLR
jgi:hypothetical protein